MNEVAHEMSMCLRTLLAWAAQELEALEVGTESHAALAGAIRSGAAALKNYEESL